MNRSKSVILVIAVVAILGAGSTLALTTTNSKSGNSSTMMDNSSKFNAVSADMGMQHIHNLMLTGNELLIGSHQGLWSQMIGKKATRVGSSRFDVMGLAMMNGMLVASGHPGAGEEGENNLGFRMSMNGGMAWDNTSLLGMVDFHRLTAAGNTAMGISASDGAMMRSEDGGKTWATLVNPGLYDFVMNPTDSKMIIGTTPSGPILSTDAGKSFKAIPNSPIVSLVSWDKARLFGVTPVGVLYQSLDMGSTWKKLATVQGEPLALTVKGDQIAILAGTTIYFSTDAGLSFKERIREVSGH